VLCVGNLTVGGTGKTPVALALGARLAARGAAVTFLTRGYGGREEGPLLVDGKKHVAAEIGDEPLLLARAGPTIVSGDRAAGAALADRMESDVIVMDDGHQNQTLAKDISVVVVDAGYGFGNGKLIPAGPLRERIDSGLARANAVIVLGEGSVELPGFGGPVVKARLVPKDGAVLAEKKVVAFAGIGRPEKFFSTVREAKAHICEAHAFDDHHVYTRRELARLRARANSLAAQLVTTEKDLVRIAPEDRIDVSTIAIDAVFEDEEAVAALLDHLFTGKNRS
jgi:tetraacyldisaccharide 4'-kinase